MQKAPRVGSFEKETATKVADKVCLEGSRVLPSERVIADELLRVGDPRSARV